MRKRLKLLRTLLHAQRIIYILLALCIAEIGVLSLPLFSRGHEDEHTILQRYTQRIIAVCAHAEDRRSCYDREIPKLMRSLSFEEVFAVLKSVQEQDGEYWYCHVVAHKIAGEEVKKDFSKWKETFTRCPANMCSNGCIHGVFMERFQQEYLNPSQLAGFEEELKGVCDARANWNPTGIERFACYHAMGHLLMYVTRADVKKSVAMCKDIAESFTDSCYDGVFMQIFQPLEAEDKALVQNIVPVQKNLASFCKSFAKEAQGSCWTEGWPLFFQLIADPQKTAWFCKQLDQSQRLHCWSGMFSRMVTHLNLKEREITNFCLGLPGKLQGLCYGISASRFIDVDKRLVKRSSLFCGTARTPDIKNECFDSIVSAIHYMFHRGTSEYAAACSVLPSERQTRC